MKWYLKLILLPAVCLCIVATASHAQKSIYVNPSLLHSPLMDNPQNKMAYTAVIAVLDSFFTSKNNSLEHNAHWLPDDFKRYKYPYQDLYRVEASYRLKDSLHFRPTLLEIIPAGDHSFLTKFAYMGQEPDGFSSLRFIYNIVVEQHKDRYYLRKATSCYTQAWKQYTEGNIRFIVSPGRHYNVTEAKRLDSVNSSFAKFLQLPVREVTYYSCVNSEELFRVKGFDYVPNMYFATTGGQADADAGIVYAAINSEWYPHELAHIYVNKLPANAGGYLATEGLCTFLGGSLNMPLRKHARAMKAYLEKDPEALLFPLLLTEKLVTENTSSVYTLGGLIAEATYSQYGLKGLTDWLKVTDSEQDIMAFFREKFKMNNQAEIEAWLRRQVNR